MSRLVPGRNYAGPLYDAIGSEAFSLVAEWLRDIAAECSLEVEDGKGPNGTARVIPPNVSWLAEVVTEYDPADESGSQ